jgi:hypothetical protein
MRERRIFLLMFAGLIFMAGWIMGQQSAENEKTIIHAVAWTAVEGAPQEAMEDFKQSTAGLVDAIPGLRKAWVGKLRRPLTVGVVSHTHGLIFEFDDMQSREAYSQHPSRDPWMQVWGKVRNTRPVVFDVIGE